MDIVGAIAAVKIVVDMVKFILPDLSGRTTQLVVAGLAVLAGLLLAGYADPLALIQAIGAIFSGAIAADQVLKREV